MFFFVEKNSKSPLNLQFFSWGAPPSRTSMYISLTTSLRTGPGILKSENFTLFRIKFVLGGFRASQKVLQIGQRYLQGLRYPNSCLGTMRRSYIALKLTKTSKNGHFSRPENCWELYKVEIGFKYAAKWWKTCLRVPVNF